MTTLAANSPRVLVGGDVNEHPVIASDIIFEGAGVGDNGAGYSRPLVAGDRFKGFAEAKVDNSAGAAGDLNVRVHEKGKVRAAISGLVITDVGQPVYMSDDDVFTLVAVGNSYIGKVHRFESSGVGVVSFDVDGIDPFGENVTRETKSANYTVDALDTGKIIYVDTDAVVVTLPATATVGDSITFVNAGAFGAVGFSMDPAAADKIMGPDIAGEDNKDLVNTKATAQRGDFITLTAGHADGWTVSRIKGTWAQEA